MKLWYIGWSVVGLGVAGSYVYVVTLVYDYWHAKAEHDASRMASYRSVCPTENPFDCTFVNVPIRINQLTEVIIPTILSCAAVLAAVVAVAVYLIRLIREVERETHK